MSDIDSNITQALNVQAEVMIAGLGYTAIWPRKGGDKPAGEHLTIQHLRNDDVPLGLSDQVYTRQGFLIVNLVSTLDGYDIVTRKQAVQFLIISRGRKFWKPTGQRSQSLAPPFAAVAKRSSVGKHPFL